MAFSKPCWPLGSFVQDGRLGVMAPYSDEADEICCVCTEPLKWCTHIDLPCGHSHHMACLTQWFLTKLKSRMGVRAAFGCPLCRASCRVVARVVDDTVPLPRIRFTDPSTRVLHAITDTYGNWTILAVTTDKGLFITSGVLSNAYQHTQTCWLNPYAGWIVPNGSPTKNPIFQILLSPASMQDV